MKALIAVTVFCLMFSRAGWIVMMLGFFTWAIYAEVVRCLRYRAILRKYNKRNPHQRITYEQRHF